MGDPERPHRLRPLPGRLQHPRDDARGQGQADPLAQPPRGRPGLALRQGPLRLPAPLRGGPDRRPARARRRRGFGELSWDDALDRAEALLRGAQGRIVTALSGSETLEQAYALGKLLRQGLGAHSAVLPEATSPALDAFRAPLSAIADAEMVVVVGDDDGRRPRADRRALDQAGAPQRRRGRPASARGRSCGDGARASACSRGCATARVLIWSGPRRRRRRAARRARRTRLGFDGKPGCGAFHLPATPNGRGVAEAWAAAADARGGEPGADRPADRLGRRGGGRPGRARARRAGRARARDHDVPRASPSAGPTSSCRGRATSSATARYVNLEGRLQRLRRAVIPPVPDELAWIVEAGRALRRRASRRTPPVVFDRARRRALRRHRRSATSASARRCPPAAPYARPSAAPTTAPRGSAGRRALPRHAAARALPAAVLRARRRARAGARSSSAPSRVIELAAEDARAARDRERRHGHVRSNGTSVELRARDQPRARAPGVARIAERARGDLHRDVEVVKRDVTEPWWISADQGVRRSSTSSSSRSRT